MQQDVFHFRKTDEAAGNKTLRTFNEEIKYQDMIGHILSLVRFMFDSKQKFFSEFSIFYERERERLRKEIKLRKIFSFTSWDEIDDAANKKALDFVLDFWSRFDNHFRKNQVDASVMSNEVVSAVLSGICRVLSTIKDNDSITVGNDGNSNVREVKEMFDQIFKDGGIHE